MTWESIGENPYSEAGQRAAQFVQRERHMNGEHTRSRTDPEATSGTEGADGEALHRGA